MILPSLGVRYIHSLRNALFNTTLVYEISQVRCEHGNFPSPRWRRSTLLGQNGALASPQSKSAVRAILQAGHADGPQIVTKRGVDTAVLLPIEQWRKLEKMTKPDLKELLLTPEARTEELTPPRVKRPHRLLAVAEYTMRRE